MDRKKKSSLYLHIPYCRRKCLYCDFFSGGEKIADWPLLTDCLLEEARRRKEELPTLPSTLYLGGGTPSLMPEESLERLMHGLHNIYEGMKPEEITIEVNPDDVSPEKAELWKSVGFNRVSIGIQSFRDEELKAMGRRHSGTQGADAIIMLKQYFDNISADLIFGLPGQTRESWEESLDRMIELRPEHISAYSLMYEDGTPLTVLRDSGKLPIIPEEDSEWMFRRLIERIVAAGYDRYEISNYSLTGRHSRHNSAYWSGNPYFGLGPSAHSYDGIRTRRSNPADLNGYLRYFREKKNPTSKFYEEEILNDEELREEYILTRMRTGGGINLTEYGEKWGEEKCRQLLKNAKPALTEKMLAKSQDQLFLTEKGIMIADRIIIDLAM